MILFYMTLTVLYTDICFYIPHRLMHNNRLLFNHIHKVHHDIIDSYAISFQYCHTIEAVINEITVSLPPILGCLPNELFYLWYITAQVSVCLCHCGYIFKNHDNHHHYKMCEYGISGLPYINMDYLLKTKYINMIDKTRCVSKNTKSNVNLN